MSSRFSNGVYYMYGSVIVVMFLLGFSSQCIALRIFTTKDFKQKPLNKLFLNLAVANLVLIIMEFPLSLLSMMTSSLVFGQIGCTIRGFIAGVSSLTMITTLYCFTARIMVLVQLDDTRENPSKASLGKLKDTTLVILSWLFSVVCMSPPLFGWSEITVEPGGLNCAPNWAAEDPSDQAYLMLLILFGYVIPVGLLGNHFVRLWNDVYYIGHQPRPLHDIQVKIRFRVMVKVVIISTAIFSFLWLPYSVFGLVSILGKADWLNNNPAAFIPPLVGKVSSLYCPVMYTVLSRR
ncbi:rhodopsin, GQ-coupled isoform X1 [Exaiptasia diaphana]|nr:rhodopsin, GQ-coupled isoform X1 [Exaiptasia diaphana]XP_028513052.1 rhodopsin, GQ-coupled isoform X1 [Exaiptasia diaphana]